MALVVKNLPAKAGDNRCEFDPWVRKIPWRRAWQPTPVFLPGESHGQSSLLRYSPQGCRVRHNWSNLAHMHTSTSKAFLFLLVARISKSGIREVSDGLHSQESMTHVITAFSQALRDSDRILSFNKNPFTRMCIWKPSLRCWLILVKEGTLHGHITNLMEKEMSVKSFLVDLKSHHHGISLHRGMALLSFFQPRY